MTYFLNSFLNILTNLYAFSSSSSTHPGFAFLNKIFILTPQFPPFSYHFSLLNIAMKLLLSTCFIFQLRHSQLHTYIPCILPFIPQSIKTCQSCGRLVTGLLVKKVHGSFLFTNITHSPHYTTACSIEQPSHDTYESVIIVCFPILFPREDKEDGR